VYGPEDFERPRLPTRHRARVELRSQARAAAVIVLLALVPVVLLWPRREEGAPVPTTGAYVCWAAFCGGWILLAAFVRSRFRVADATITLSDEGIDFTASRGSHRIAWADVGRIRFASAPGPAQALTRVALGSAFGPAAAMLAGGARTDNAFAGPGPSRGTRVPFGAVYDKNGRRVMAFSEAFDWPLYDDLGPEAYARGVPIEADRVLVAPPA